MGRWIGKCGGGIGDGIPIGEHCKEAFSRLDMFANTSVPVACEFAALDVAGCSTVSNIDHKQPRAKQELLLPAIQIVHSLQSTLKLINKNVPWNREVSQYGTLRYVLRPWRSSHSSALTSSHRKAHCTWHYYTKHCADLEFEYTVIIRTYQHRYNRFIGGPPCNVTSIRTEY